MSSVQHLREFISERLTAAAEEIFTEFEKTIVQYEEEMDRQRRLLDITWKPHIHLNPIDHPQHHACKEEDASVDQQLCHMEEDSSLSKEKEDPPQIKEEHEEFDISLKQETDTFMVTPCYEENDHRGPPPNRDQLFSQNSPEYAGQDQEGSKHEDSGSTKNSELKPKTDHISSKDRSNSNYVENFASDTEKKLMKGEVSVKAEKDNGLYQKSQTDKRPYFCKTCGKRFTRSNHLTVHMQTHTGEKPYSCEICGKAFREKSKLTVHMRKHTGEKPYSCKICGQCFSIHQSLTSHMRTHTGEKPYPCKTCGKGFSTNQSLTSHMRTHTGEKPYPCKTCGKCFSTNQSLTAHVRTHTGEKPYPCKTCGKGFSTNQHLITHKRTHTGEKPYPCKTCGKCFTTKGNLLTHMRTHTGERPYSC